MRFEYFYGLDISFNLSDSHFSHFFLVYCPSFRISPTPVTGWDRTSQITALACLILDPFYRTLPGFCVLVQREWILAGHKFEDRTGYLAQNETSPVFLQFLDCCWQVMRQTPDAFEFNEDLLAFLAVHAYSRWFPDFSCNSDRERQELVTESSSIWSFIEAQQHCFKNRAYYMSKSSSQGNLDHEIPVRTKAGTGEDEEGTEGAEEQKSEKAWEDQGLQGTAEKLSINCGDVIFWQSFFRGGFIPIVNSVAAQYTSVELVRHCHVERFDPSEGNVLAALQGTHPGGKLYGLKSDGADASLSELGSAKTRGLLPSSRARRLSVLETLKDPGFGGGDAGAAALVPTQSGGCCTVQ